MMQKVGKILFIIGVAISVITGIAPTVAIPGLATGAILAIIGAIAGYTDDSDVVTVLVTAVALATVAGALAEIPAIGGPITGILKNISTVISAGALVVIVKGVIARVSACCVSA